MKKIHTPISSSIGNQEMKACARKDGGSGCLTSNFTPLLTRSPTRPRSRLVVVALIFLPSLVTAVIV